MKNYLIPLLFTLSVPSLGQARLSDQSKVFMLTFGPGQQQVYTCFGHSAIRITDASKGIDLVYNYGTFDFDQKNFYLNFAIGEPYYSLAIGKYEHTEYVYMYFNQSIYQQELNLTLSQRQTLFEFLNWNSLPENKDYLYDYFYDNCSTRIPDAFFHVFGDRIYLDTITYVTEARSFRDMVNVYTPLQPWGDLGIDLGLAIEIDKIMQPGDYLFLPEYLYEAVDNGTILHGDSIVPLVKDKRVIFEAKPVEYNLGFFTPKKVFWLLLLVVAGFTLWEILKRRHLKLIDVILFSPVWLLGIFLVILWFGTEHKSAWNFNLLWANPFHGIFLYFLIKNKKPKLIVYHFLGYGILLLLTLVFWRVLPQALHPAFVPLVIALALRSFWVYRVTTSIRSWTSE
jgi:hypothetical protein